MRACSSSIAVVGLSFLLFAACSDDEEPATGGASGKGGASGAAGSGGASGSGGSSGASGSGGSAGSGGASGSAGALGSGGSSGSAGAAGSAGSAGAAGDGGPGGTAGDDAGGDGAVSANMSFFITSTGSGTEGGNLGGLAGADAKCQMLAMAVGLGNKTWRAYLSIIGGDGGANDNARTRIGSGPWFNARGVKIADTVEQLHEEGGATNNLNAQTGLDERGQTVPGRDGRPQGVLNQHDILTGSAADGRAATGNPTPNCSNWTASTGQAAQVGHFDRVGTGSPTAASWNAAHAVQGCSEANLRGTGGAGRIYCFATN